MQNEKNKLFVKSLPYEIDDEALEKLFSEVEGVKVVEAKVILDRDNGNQSKGFGFVTLENEEMAQACISALNGKKVSGRELYVNVARPPEKRDSNRGGYDSGRRSYR